MLEFRLVEENVKTEWNQRVAVHQAGSIFHTWEWMQVVERIYHAQPLPVGIFEGTEMIGVYPLFRTQKGPLTVLASPIGGVGYGGPLVDDRLLPEIIARQDELVRRFGADYVELRTLNHAMEPFLAQGNYTLERLRTIALKLDRDLDELWRNLKGPCRTAVRRARKNNVVIRAAQDDRFLDTYSAMSADTYAKTHRPPPLSRHAYATVWNLLRPSGKVEVLLATHEDRIVAGGFFLHFANRVYYWDGAAFRADYRLNANNLLHWTVIERAADRGYEEYDMLGGNIPSIARFKQSFGGREVEYVDAYKDVTPQAYVGRRLYRRFMPPLRKALFRLRSFGQHQVKEAT
jgi:hypothetical protein